MQNQPKSIFLSVNPGEDTNNFTASVKSVWFQIRERDTDLEYISLESLTEGKADNELTGWFLTNLLRRPEMAEHIAVSLIDRGYGKINTP